MSALRDAEVKSFIKRVESLVSHYNELKIAIHNKKNEASLQNELAVQLSISISVQWESFIHDLIVAYVLTDPSRAFEWLENRARKSIEDKFGPVTEKCFTFCQPTGLNKEKIQELLDPKGWNITAHNARELANRSSELLASRYAMRFALDADNSEFYDYVVALRNYLSHRSKGARTTFKNSVNGLSSVKNFPLKTNIGKTDFYLKSLATAKTISRVEYIANRLKEIATIL
jgi:hypothetical protein